MKEGNGRYYRLLYTILCLMLGYSMVFADTEFTLEQFTTADGLANNTVRHIMQDSKGRYWFATSNGASCYADNHFTNYRPSRDKSTVSLIDQRTKEIHEDAHKRLWIYTANGFSCFDIKTNSFIEYAKQKITIPVFKEKSSKEITDSQGRVWRVTDSDGLYIINKDGSTEHFTTSSKNNPLPTNALKCIYQDKEGVIWIGTDNLGVSRITVIQNTGVEYMQEGENIRMVATLGKDKVAVANRNGDVWIYNNDITQLLSHHTMSHNTYSMLQDYEGNIWQGTKGGGLFVNQDSVKGMPHNEIYSIVQTNDSSIWIGTFGEGIVAYDIKSKSIAGRLLTGSYGSKRIRKMVADKAKDIWVATSEGVFVINNGKGNRILQHLCTGNDMLYSDEIRTIATDSKGAIYIAETGEGFAIYNKGAITHFTQEDSLVNNMVQCFVEDNQGFIWISTEFGISRFNPVTKKFTNYFFSRNMLNNVYSENCGIKLNDGRIVFGTNNGLIIIKPSAYNKSERTTDIEINDITINGQPVKHGIIYVVSQWWTSPWFYVIIATALAIFIFIMMRVRRNNSRFHKAIKELNTKKDALTVEKQELAAQKEVLTAEKEVLSAQKEELTAQTEVLAAEKEELSEQKEKLTRDVHIRREADQSASDKEFIAQVEAIANAEIANPNFSADDFADRMGLGRTVFFRKMKEITGYSPKEYMKLKRIHQAADLISTTSLTIAEIAYKVGINDPLYLSRIFKAEYKCTPTEWRRNV